MRRSVWAAALLGLVAVTLLSSSVEAQRQRRPTPAQQQRAREAYARGQQLFREGQFQQAEEAFQEAYDTIPNAVVLISIAEAREQQGDLRGTVESLERYVAERPDAPDVAQIQARVTDLRARPSTVHVESTPSGAEIAVDGEPTRQRTPADIQLAPGQYTIELRLAGHEPASQTVDVVWGERGEVTATLVEQPPPAGEEPFGAGEEPLPVEEPTGSEPVSAEPARTGPSTPVWIAAGIGGVGLVTGTVLGFLALSEQSEFDDTPTDETADRGERLALFADVAFGVAIAGAATAIVLYVTDDRRGGDEPVAGATAARLEVQPVVGTRGGGAVASVRF